MATCHVGAFGGNFGDMLGPDIVKRIVEYHFGCSANNVPVVDFEVQKSLGNNKSYDGPCLFTVGSVWRNVRNNDHVWGTGSFGNSVEFQHVACRGYKGRFNNVTVYSARGPRTADIIKKVCRRRIQTLDEEGYTKNLTGIPPYGDGGFLVPFVFPELDSQDKRIQRFNSCIILHKYDEETFTDYDAAVRETFLRVIQPWQTMAANITQCKVVSSSSLHGLMLADAYGVPSRWIQQSKAIFPFKFLDYFDSVGHSKDGLRLKVVVHNDTLPVPEVASAQERSTYASKVIQSFPLHLFETKVV
jgi:hypothetical protein